MESSRSRTSKQQRSGSCGGSSHRRRVLALDRRLARLVLAAGGACPHALEQALHARPISDGLVQHSDRGVQGEFNQYPSMRDAQRLAEAGIESSVGTVADSCDDALAGSVIGSYETEVIRRCCPWRKIEDVECATLDWVDGFNQRWLLEPLGWPPPAEHESAFYLGQAGGDQFARKLPFTQCASCPSIPRATDPSFLVPSGRRETSKL